MAENKMQAATQQPPETASVSLKEKGKEAGLASALNALSKFGGFNFLESTVDGIQNLNPERKARKKIFLTDEQKQSERDALSNKIDMWLDLLTSSSDVTEMLSTSKAKAEAASEHLSKSQLIAAHSVRNLEQAYRGVMLFYKNTEADKVNNVTIINASKEQITDLDNSRFIDFVAQELKQNFDKLDLRQNYSLMAIPGYLGSSKVVEKWSKIAHDNKVMLYTDFADLEKPDDVVEMFFSSNLASSDPFKCNTAMVCNWLIGRPKYKEIGEEEDLRVSPSIALMGKVYSTLMSQVTAGKKYGGINEVDAVMFPLKKSEISQLEKMGLIPMVNEYGKVMAFSAKTLFSGDNLGLQTYSVVRVFDYITKVLFDFLNRRSFENWNSKTERDLRGEIVKFLDSVQGADRLIEKFKVIRFEQDPNQKDRIYLDIHMTPFFPAKSFVIKLDGTKGDDGATWNTDYEQA